MRLLPAIMIVLLAASAASAQQTKKNGNLPMMSGGSASQPAIGENKDASPVPGGEATMAQLISRGYEIKAAVPNGGKFIVFMQKEQSAYACEFSSLTNTRCGSLN